MSKTLVQTIFLNVKTKLLSFSTSLHNRQRQVYGYNVCADYVALKAPETHRRVRQSFTVHLLIQLSGRKRLQKSGELKEIIFQPELLYFNCL